MNQELTEAREINFLDTNKESVKLTIADVKKYVCPLATDKEIFIFMGYAQYNKLNWFKREIHLIKYDEKNPASIVTGYEVYINRAERSGKLTGWSIELAEAKDQATITICRKDWEKPFIWTVQRSEFDKKQATWLKMPLFMTQKVAISQGFRLAFPEECGSLPYTKEEYEVYGIDKMTKKPDVEMPVGKSERKAAEPVPAAIDTKTEPVPDKLDQVYEKATPPELAKLIKETFKAGGFLGRELIKLKMTYEQRILQLADAKAKTYSELPKETLIKIYKALMAENGDAAALLTGDFLK
jgi:phage recombination protein Bet